MLLRQPLCRSLGSYAAGQVSTVRCVGKPTPNSPCLHLPIPPASSRSRTGTPSSTPRYATSGPVSSVRRLSRWVLPRPTWTRSAGPRASAPPSGYGRRAATRTSSKRLGSPRRPRVAMTTTRRAKRRASGKTRRMARLQRTSRGSLRPLRSSFLSKPLAPTPTSKLTAKWKTKSRRGRKRRRRRTKTARTRSVRRCSTSSGAYPAPK